MREWLPSRPQSHKADVIVYGATAAGVIAAVRCATGGASVIVANPGWVVGGMTSGGLGFTDFGNKSIVGGLAKEFYRRVGAAYGKPEAWKFEPHVARSVFEAWLRELNVTVIHGLYLDKVTLGDAGIAEIRCIDGSVLKGRSFIDASYEGDLMAGARVKYRIGREPTAEYGEDHNGAQLDISHQFDTVVDPWRTPGNPDSGTCWGIQPGNYEQGKGGTNIQAYNFRVCMTDDPANRIPFFKPDNYKPEHYELAARWLKSTKADVFRKFDRITDTKTDTNNYGGFSTDMIGGSWDWPLASVEKREQIFQAHFTYQAGLHWFMANDGRVPDAIRLRYAEWGLAADEFTETGHWPHQLYIREARRMVADYVLTERNCQDSEICSDPVGMAAYAMDSHNVYRLVVDGAARNEGDVQVWLKRPYGIPYRAIVPQKGSVGNLAVPVCVSASHIAFGSLRMEPVFMVLGQSAAIAASMAIDKNIPVQQVEYNELQKVLLENKQRLK